MTGVEPHSFKTDILREIEVFPFWHPRLTSLRRFEHRLQKLLQVRNKVDSPLTLFRKNHRFGTENRVKSPIIAVKCEENTATIVRYALVDIATSQYIGRKAAFLPHGLIHKIGPDKYRNILIDHNRYFNSIQIVTMFDVEEEPLRQSLLNVWEDEDTGEHTVIDFLTEHYGLISVEKAVQDGKVFFLNKDKETLDKGLRLLLLNDLKRAQTGLVPTIKLRVHEDYNPSSTNFVYHITNLTETEPLENFKQRHPNQRKLSYADITRRDSTKGSSVHSKNPYQQTHQSKTTSPSMVTSPSLYAEAKRIGDRLATIEGRSEQTKEAPQPMIIENMSPDSLFMNESFIKLIVGRVEEILVQPIRDNINYLENELDDLSLDLTEIKEVIDKLERTTQASLKETEVSLTKTINENNKKSRGTLNPCSAN